MEIKRLNEDMLEEATELYMAVFSAAPWYDVFESKEAIETFIGRFLVSDTYVNFVVILEEELVGLCLGMKKPWEKGLEYYIDTFCVKSSLQGQGIGSRFLQEIEARIELLGMDSMILNTEKNYPSEDFYKKNGFKQLSELIVMGK